MTSIEDIVRRIVREEVRAALGQPVARTEERTPSESLGGALSAEDAALYLGGAPITANTLRTLARNQNIGHVRVGRTNMFPIAALDAYLKEHTVAVKHNPWGLTDRTLQGIRTGRAARTGRRTAIDGVPLDK